MVVGRTKDEICPVTTLLCYLSLRGNSSGPLFHWKDGIPLTRTHFVVKVRWALTQAHLPAKGHSFCIGAATTATGHSSQIRRFHDTDSRPLEEHHISDIYQGRPLPFSNRLPVPGWVSDMNLCYLSCCLLSIYLFVRSHT